MSSIIFYEKITEKINSFKMSSAAVVIGTLRVNTNYQCTAENTSFMVISTAPDMEVSLSNLLLFWYKNANFHCASSLVMLHRGKSCAKITKKIIF